MRGADGWHLEVRSARRGDVAAVLALWSDAETRPSVTDDGASVGRLLAHDPDALVVAVLDGAIVGTLVAGWDGWRGSFYRLAVLPAFRRRGVALNLVREGERRLGARGAVRFTAVVVSGDDPASRLWSAAGYADQRGRTRYVKNLGGP